MFARFDLIYLILDKADEQTDRRLAKHIVSLHFKNPEVGWFSFMLIICSLKIWLYLVQQEFKKMWWVVFWMVKSE